MLQGFRNVLHEILANRGWKEGPCQVAGPVLTNSPKFGRTSSASLHVPSMPFLIGFNVIYIFGILEATDQNWVDFVGGA